MVTTESDRLTIKEQAAAWLVKIDGGELDYADNAAFNDWLNADEQHRVCFFTLSKHWDSLAVVQILADYYPLPAKKAGATAAHSKPEPQINADESVGWLAALFSTKALAGYAVATCALLLAITLGLNTHELETYQTLPGERMSFQLSDGSTVTLNTNTRVAVNYTDEKRRISLLQGEANFAVAKDKTRPFVVEAGGGLVWAVGTVFNVRFTEPEVAVMVSEGTVKVFADTSADAAEFDSSISSSATNTEALVNAGNAVSFQRIVSAIQPLSERKLAWLEDSLIFEGETLQEAVAEIARYTHYQIVIADDSIKSLRIGGHYNTKDIESLLVTLSRSFDIKATKQTNNKIVLTKK